MLGRLARVLLVLAVLLAQQSALAHQYWHAAKASVAADAQKAPKPDRLCNLHDLLGTVLGIASGAVQVAALLELSQSCFVTLASELHEASVISPHSRDPPLIG